MDGPPTAPRPPIRLSQAFRQDQRPGSGANKDDKAASSWTSALYSKHNPLAVNEEGSVATSEGQYISGWVYNSFLCMHACKCILDSSYFNLALSA